MATTRYAVIELGTRGIRLLIADASADGINDIVFSTGGFSELGEGLDAAGNLAASAIEHCRRQVEAYTLVAREHGAEEVLAFATEAVRAAPNQAEFLDALAPFTSVEVIDAQDEALYSLLASVHAFRDALAPGDTMLVVDQGGGSTELACGVIAEDGTLRVQGRRSMPVGTVELIEQLDTADTVGAGIRRVLETVFRAIVKEAPFPTLRAHPPVAVYGLGSAITGFAQQILTQGSERRSLREIHGQRVSRKALDSWLETVTKQAGEVSLARLNLDDAARTRIVGALAYYLILREYQAPAITVSRHGLRYGYLLARAGYPYHVEEPPVEAPVD